MQYPDRDTPPLDVYGTSEDSLKVWKFLVDHFSAAGIDEGQVIEQFVRETVPRQVYEMVDLLVHLQCVGGPKYTDADAQREDQDRFVKYAVPRFQRMLPGLARQWVGELAGRILKAWQISPWHYRFPIDTPEDPYDPQATGQFFGTRSGTMVTHLSPDHTLFQPFNPEFYRIIGAARAVFYVLERRFLVAGGTVLAEWGETPGLAREEPSRPGFFVLAPLGTRYEEAKTEFQTCEEALAHACERSLQGSGRYIVARLIRIEDLY